MNEADDVGAALAKSGSMGKPFGMVGQRHIPILAVGVVAHENGKFALFGQDTGAVADEGRIALDMTTFTKNAQAASKAPSLIAYHVRERKGTTSIWTRIGGAWEHSDGQGFNIQIETVPLDGRIVLRVASESKE